ncbi:MAG: AAA family ATPase [Nitrolancea sp.]
MNAAAPYVFISYASADRDRVLPLVDRLEAAGVRTWIDRDGIHGGANYALEITEAIKNASVLLLFCSTASLASRNIRQELALGWRFEKPYLPLLLEPVNVPDEVAYWLEAAQWVEILDRSESDWLGSVAPALAHHGIEVQVPEAETTATTRERPLLVGREREQAILREHLDRMFAGQGGTMLVGGEAGIGKTTLVDDLSVLAEEAGCLVLWGHAYDFSVTPPYGPWLEIWRQYRSIADASLPPLPAFIDNPEELAKFGSQQTLFAGIVDFFRSVSTQRPLVLALDDLHWFDQASLDFVRFLSRQLADRRILLIATYRSDELHRRHPVYTLLPLLVREAGATRLEVRALDALGYQALLASRYDLSQADEIRLERYLEEHSEGNPLYASELLRTLEEEHVLAHGGDGWMLGNLNQVRVPPMLLQVIEGRLARLSDKIRALLDIAAVIGQEVPLDLWQQVTNADDDSLIAALEQGREAQLVEEGPGGDAWHFHHALIREALYANLVSLRRRALHRQVAEHLARRGSPDPDTVSYHFQAAGDPRAVGWLIKAGDRAQRAYVWSAAVERFEAAMTRLTDQGAPPVERATLLFRIAHLQRNTNGREALSYLREARRLALEGHEVGLATACLQIIALIECLLEEMRPGIAAMEQATEEYRSLSPAAKTRLLELIGLDFGTPEGSLAVWLAGVGRIEEARAHADHMIRESPSPVLEPGQTDSWYADGVLASAVAAALGGQPTVAREAFEQTTAMYRAIGHLDMVVHCIKRRLDECELYYFPDEVETRLRLAVDGEEAGRRARAAGSPINPPGSVEHGLLVLGGDWLRAREIAETEINREHPIAVQQGSHWFVQLAFRQGDVKRAKHIVGKILPGGHDMEPGAVMIAPALSLQRLSVEMALDAHDLSAARAWLEAHDRWLEWSGAVLGRAEGAVLWAQYFHSSGDASLARHHAEQALAQANDPRQPLVLLAVHRFLGELDVEAKQFEAAEEHLQQSLKLADACAAPFERALTLLEIAKLRAAQGASEKVRELLAEVRSICEPLGAKPTLEHVAALEQQLGEQLEALNA